MIINRSTLLRSHLRYFDSLEKVSLEEFEKVIASIIDILKSEECSNPERIYYVSRLKQLIRRYRMAIVRDKMKGLMDKTKTLSILTDEEMEELYKGSDKDYIPNKTIEKIPKVIPENKELLTYLENLSKSHYVSREGNKVIIKYRGQKNLGLNWIQNTRVNITKKGGKVSTPRSRDVFILTVEI